MIQNYLSTNLKPMKLSYHKSSQMKEIYITRSQLSILIIQNPYIIINLSSSRKYNSLVKSLPLFNLNNNHNKKCRYITSPVGCASNSICSNWYLRAINLAVQASRQLKKVALPPALPGLHKIFLNPCTYIFKQ